MNKFQQLVTPQHVVTEEDYIVNKKMWRCLHYSRSIVHRGNQCRGKRRTTFVSGRFISPLNSHSLLSRAVSKKNGISVRWLANATAQSTKLQEFREKLKNSPTLAEFMNDDTMEMPHASSIPYLSLESNVGQGRRVYIESYGCQMNINDTEIVYGIMEKEGYQKADNVDMADVVLLNTCAVREHAEAKIWSRLGILKQEKLKRQKTRPLIVGILGCMAERLKEQLLEKDKSVDLVAGPDAYRDLPRLLSQAESGAQAMNVQLSLDETYADITPVRHNSNGVTAYVSIMRGCNNMCTYCIVPFTRGRERSRPADSIVAEIRKLSEMGFKEVVLLGQNVNSYNDMSGVAPDRIDTLPTVKHPNGFKTIYKPPKMGISFAELLDRVSQIDPEMRIRFTSPHPKDFPNELLQVIKEKPNICKAIHIPAQSGSTAVLERMRRGYSREAYLELIQQIKETIPDVALSSDFISGFCGETEDEHKDTLSLMETVQYDQCFMFAFSMREKTPAYRKYKDDVPMEVKKRRLNEVIETFNSVLKTKNLKELKKKHLVLVEGVSRKSENELSGRSDSNKKVIFAEQQVPTLKTLQRIVCQQQRRSDNNTEDEEYNTQPKIPLHLKPEDLQPLKPGDYVIVEVTEARDGVALRGRALAKTTLTEYQSNLPLLDTLP